MSEKIVVPVLGESITEATVAKWLKNTGDAVEADEPIVELETDKVNLEVPSPVKGVLTEINSKDGSVVEVGALLGTVSESGSSVSVKKDDVILFRIEQLYPFPAKTLVKELKPYAKNAKFFWCQEEPKNMGAWFSVRDYIQWTLDTIKANNNKISYIGRSPDASPATGYAKRHISQQQEIINKVFE